MLSPTTLINIVSDGLSIKNLSSDISSNISPLAGLGNQACTDSKNGIEHNLSAG